MSDETLRIGQHFPDGFTTGGGVSGGAAPGLSFEEVLNRQQLTSAKLNTLQPPSTPAATASNRPLTIAQTTPEIASKQVDDAPRLIEKPLPPELESQTHGLLSHAPASIPEGDALAEAMIRNYKEYQQQAASPRENSAVGVAGQQWTVDGNQSSVESAPSATLGSEHPSAGIFNRVLSRMNEQQDAQSLGHGQPSTTVASASQHSEAQDTPQRKVIWNANMDGEQTSVIMQNLFHDDGSIREEGWAALASESEKVRSANLTRGALKSFTNEAPTRPERQGITDAFGSFFKNLLSGLSLGFYQPDGETAPTGVMRVIDPFKKLVFDAPIKSLAIGVPVGVYHSAGNLVRGAAEDDTIARKETAMMSGRRSSPKPWLDMTRV